MESNISRDHIALEAMKCMMMTAKRRRTLWNRIVTLFFPSKEVSVTNYYYKEQAKSAYQIADAMIKERNKKVMKPNKDGLEKEVKEHFITDCSLFAEAEAKGLEQYASDNMESDVFSISRSNIIEIINEKTEDKPFFKATIVDTQIDENGNEKELKYYNLVCAKDLKEANTLMEQHLSQGLSDMRLDAIVKTKIIDLI